MNLQNIVIDLVRRLPMAENWLGKLAETRLLWDEFAPVVNLLKVSLFFFDHWLAVVVGDTQSDSIQCLNFAKTLIHSIFDSILLYPRFNSKY